MKSMPNVLWFNRVCCSDCFPPNLKKSFYSHFYTLWTINFSYSKFSSIANTVLHFKNKFSTTTNTCVVIKHIFLFLIALLWFSFCYEGFPVDFQRHFSWSAGSALMLFITKSQYLLSSFRQFIKFYKPTVWQFKILFYKINLQKCEKYSMCLEKVTEKLSIKRINMITNRFWSHITILIGWHSLFTIPPQW